jgi:hypothetical protein
MMGSHARHKSKKLLIGKNGAKRKIRKSIPRLVLNKVKVGNLTVFCLYYVMTKSTKISPIKLCVLN